MKNLSSTLAVALFFCSFAYAEVIKPSYVVIKDFAGHKHNDSDYLLKDGSPTVFPNGFPPTFHNFSDGKGYSEYRKVEPKEMKTILNRLSDVSPYFGGAKFQPQLQQGEKPLDARSTLAIKIAEGVWNVERVREINGSYLESTRQFRDEGTFIIRELQVSRLDADSKPEERTIVIREYYSKSK